MHVGSETTTDLWYYTALHSQHLGRYACSAVMEFNLFEKYEAGAHRKMQQSSVCMFLFVHAHEKTFFLTEWLHYCAAWNLSSSILLWRKNVNISKHAPIWKGRCSAGYKNIQSLLLKHFSSYIFSALGLLQFGSYCRQKRKARRSTHLFWLTILL